MSELATRTCEVRRFAASPRGRLVGDRYRLDAVLPTGGATRVWRATDVALDRAVAVTVVRPGHPDDRLALTRFRREAQLCAALTHPNITAVHDFGESGTGPGRSGDRVGYLVTELVDGRPLSSVLADGYRLDPARTLEILRQAATGLAAAHAAGISHRDVQAASLLLDDDGTVTITGFGVATLSSGQRVEAAAAGPAGDVHALGAVAYECLAGRRPVEGENRLPDDVPEGLRNLVARMLVTDAGERFPDGAALLCALDEVLTGRPEPGPLAAEPGVPARRRHAAPRRGVSRRAVLAMFGLLAGGAAALGLLVSHGDRLPVTGVAVPPTIPSGGTLPPLDQAEEFPSDASDTGTDPVPSATPDAAPVRSSAAPSSTAPSGVAPSTAAPSSAVQSSAVPTPAPGPGKGSAGRGHGGPRR